MIAQRSPRCQPMRPQTIDSTLVATRMSEVPATIAYAILAVGESRDFGSGDSQLEGTLSERRTPRG